MAAGGFLPDEYTWRARLVPALLVSLPLGLVALAWFPGSAPWEVLWSVLVAAGGTLLMSQLARDWGKRKEGALFDRFGGRPTEMMLSHAHATNKAIVLARHRKLKKQFPHLRIPTELEEARNPHEAFKAYEACTEALIAKTRDRGRFPLVFEENCNFGFRRNLWGMKAVALSIAGVGLIGVVTHAYYQFMQDESLVAQDAGAAGLLLLLLLILALRVTPAWVMIPAREYAKRLFEALDQL